MRRVSVQLLTALIGIMTAAVYPATPSMEQQSQFFAGVFLLQSKADLPPGERAKLFHSLETVTGITAVTATGLLAYYRTKPAEWQKLYALINTLVAQIPAQSKATALPPEPFPPQPLKRREPHVGFYRR